MRYKFYTSNENKCWFMREVKDQHIVHNLTVKHVPGAVISVDKEPGGYGVFDNDGKFVKESLSYRNKTGQYIPLDSGKSAPYVDSDVVYLGNLELHFGHFLLEHWNRTWAFLDSKYKGMKFIFVNDAHMDVVPKFVFDLAHLLGIPDENLIILNETTRFKNVYIPQQGFNIPVLVSREFGDTFAQIANNVTGKGKDKIYVSRAKLGVRKTHGEEKIQEIFKKNGYKIIYPETLPLAEQISYMKDCKSLAGCAGTALHLSLFMPTGGHVILLRRNTVFDDSSPTQKMLCECRGQDLTVIAASIEKMKTGHCGVPPQIIGVNKYLKQFFDDNGFEYDDLDQELDLAAHDKYMTDLEAYLTKFGSPLRTRVLNKLVRLSACLVPGRRNRKKFRKYLKRIWKL